MGNGQAKRMAEQILCKTRAIRGYVDSGSDGTATYDVLVVHCNHLVKEDQFYCPIPWGPSTDPKEDDEEQNGDDDAPQ